MSSFTFSFYRLDDGVFTGTAYTGAQELLQRNVPAGCGFMLGTFDHLSQRVDPETGEVLDWQPPKPDDTDLHTHTWDEEVKRWVRTPTLRSLKNDRLRPVQRRIEALEVAKLRPLGAVVVAMLEGRATPMDDTRRLAEIEAQLEAARVKHRAIEAARNDDELRGEPDEVD